jgi:hypothetical protein
VGDVSDQGIYSLKLSINQWKKLYQDKFDIIVCWNGKKPNITDLQLVNQHEFIDSISVSPPSFMNPAWKIYPPRLRLNSHEIFIDNDVILHQKIPLIDHFLQSQTTIICTEAAKRSYGYFDKLIHNTTELNSGLFGLPPNFNLVDEINLTLKETNFKSWIDHLDEQGLLSYIFLKKNCQIIPIEDIIVLMESPKLFRSMKYGRYGRYGAHFVGLNINQNKFWLDYIGDFLI